MKRKLNIKKLGIFLLVLIVIGVSTFFILKSLFNGKKKIEIATKTPPVASKVTAGIYTMMEDSTNYQKAVFNELKVLLEQPSYTDQALAEVIAKNFIVEFYNLSNVNSKYVRGGQFVAPELKPRFETFGKDIYDYYQYYPNIKTLEVKDIKITNTKTITYDYIDDLKLVASKKGLNGYLLTVSWSYIDNTKNITKVTIVKWNENYSIVKVDNTLNK